MFRPILHPSVVQCSLSLEPIADDNLAEECQGERFRASGVASGYVNIRYQDFFFVFRINLQETQFCYLLMNANENKKKLIKVKLSSYDN